MLVLFPLSFFVLIFWQYFHLAKDGQHMQKELVDRVKNLHLSDCLRANKSTMAWGLEVRCPSLIFLPFFSFALPSGSRAFLGRGFS